MFGRLITFFGRYSASRKFLGGLRPAFFSADFRLIPANMTAHHVAIGLHFLQVLWQRASRWNCFVCVLLCRPSRDRMDQTFLPRDALVHSAVLRLHVVRLSVRPSVCWWIRITYVGWKSWELIARTPRPTPSLFVAQRPSTYSQGNMGKFRGDKRWGGRKWRAGAQKRQYLWNA